MSRYISQKDIRFDIDDVPWLLEILPQLRDGRYPEPATGPVDEPPANSKRSEHAPFEDVALLAVEVEERLTACERDGVLLEACYTFEMPVEKAAVLVGELPDRTMRRLDSALKYIASGWCRRWIPCDKCWRLKVCRLKKRKDRTPVTYRAWKRQF